ncbi:hypothetical protein [Desulforamulus ruminis]|nr:hypothetical protein [Desulforamulus ruminis]
MRESTWRFPNLGFWAIHVASLATLGYFAYKATDCRCKEGTLDDLSFSERNSRNQTSGFQDHEF